MCRNDPTCLQHDHTVAVSSPIILRLHLIGLIPPKVLPTLDLQPAKPTFYRLPPLLINLHLQSPRLSPNTHPNLNLLHPIHHQNFNALFVMVTLGSLAY